MQTLLEGRVLDRRVVIATTDRTDGNVHPLHVAAGELVDRQRRTTGDRWAMLDQRHGTDRVRARRADESTIGIGDVLVSDDPDLTIAVWAADCAALVFATEDGRRVGAHAGWRGLAAGVIEVAVEALGSRPVVLTALGPTIGPCCYSFGADDLERVAVGVDADPDAIASTTTNGALALDVPAAIDLALERHGLAVQARGPCTRCHDRWYSHRRGDTARHAVVAWSTRAS